MFDYSRSFAHPLQCCSFCPFHKMTIHQIITVVLLLCLMLHQIEHIHGEEDTPSEIGQSTTYRTWMERTLQRIKDISSSIVPSSLRSNADDHSKEGSSDGGYGGILNIFKSKIHLIFPGTRWCGDGNIAVDNTDIGIFRHTDACCRQHDKCEFNIRSGQCFENLQNDGLFTRSACECDQEFYHCLKEARNPLSYDIGYTYFNVLKPQCIIYFHPIVSCKERDGLTITKCIAYDSDGSQPKEYQWIDNPNF